MRRQVLPRMRALQTHVRSSEEGGGSSSTVLGPLVLARSILLAAGRRAACGWGEGRVATACVRGVLGDSSSDRCAVPWCGGLRLELERSNRVQVVAAPVLRLYLNVALYEMHCLEGRRRRRRGRREDGAAAASRVRRWRYCVQAGHVSEPTITSRPAGGPTRAHLPPATTRCHHTHDGYNGSSGKGGGRWLQGGAKG